MLTTEQILALKKDKKITVLETELTDEDIIIKEIYDTKALPKHKHLEKRGEFSIILDVS